MRNQAALSTLLVVTSLAACAPSEPPTKPSWDQDVFPILQGSCNHCHGSLVGQDGNQKAPLTRLDVCSGQPFAENMISLPGVILGAGLAAGTFNQLLTVQKGATRAQMPPPPASPLSDYERAVLLSWGRMAASIDACTKKVKNRPATAKASQQLEGANLAVTLEVSDPDGDQVLGKITAGGLPAQTIISSGRRTFYFSGLPVGSPVKVTLHDGYDKIDMDL